MDSHIVFTLLVLFSCILLGAQACKPNACAVVKCAQTTEEMCLAKGPVGHYRYLPHGGVCGCCSNCIKLMLENETCEQFAHVNDIAPKLCATGLVCDQEKHVCVNNVVA